MLVSLREVLPNYTFLLNMLILSTHNMGGLWNLIEFGQSFMNRMGLVKRKGTKAARKLPDDFPAIKVQYLKRIKEIVDQYKIPDQLIVN